MFKDKFKSARSRIAAVFLLAAISAISWKFGPAISQGFVANFAPGTPLGPALFANVDPLTGIYFGPSATPPRVGISAHLEAGARANALPTASICGAAVDAGSTDFAGTITNVGTTTCTITFGQAYAAAPACVVTDQTTNRATMATVTTTTAITITGITAADRLSWICVARSGG
jgi:hypothetical protein